MILRLGLPVCCLLFTLSGAVNSQCAGCGADHNRAERESLGDRGGSSRDGQGGRAGEGGRNGADADRPDTGSKAADSPREQSRTEKSSNASSGSHSGSSSPATSGSAANEHSFGAKEFVERIANNPDFGNIEPGSAETAMKAGEWVREAIHNWDSSRGILDNLKAAVGPKSERATSQKKPENK